MLACTVQLSTAYPLSFSSRECNEVLLFSREMLLSVGCFLTQAMCRKFVKYQFLYLPKIFGWEFLFSLNELGL